jgi:hypothetical protein
MFDYLSASIGPVVDGLEEFEKIYALEQGCYVPLRTLPGNVKAPLPTRLTTLPAENSHSAITRWELSPEQRQMIADGADIFLEVIHFGGPLAPVRMAIGKQENDAELWNRWFCAQTNGPYGEELKRRREEAL